jgi:ABC-2 type transport system permease protein
MEETIIPKTSTVLFTLFRADLATLKSNRRSAIITFFVPLVILIFWKGLIDKNGGGGTFVLSTAITMGLVAIGLMGYTISISRDRDKGIFQRLRVAPMPTWAIMASRISIQLLMIMVLTLAVFIIGFEYDKILLSWQGYVITFFIAFLGGAVYLSVGQLIVGLIKNPETVNATTRLVYFLFIMLGMVGDLLVKNQAIRRIIHWSPYGSVKLMLAASMEPAKWNNNTTIAVLVTLCYIVVFAGIGIKNFKWSSK